MTTLKVFEILLLKNSPVVVSELALRFLAEENYIVSKTPEETDNPPQSDQGEKDPDGTPSEDATPEKASENDEKSVDQGSKEDVAQGSPSDESKTVAHPEKSEDAAESGSASDQQFSIAGNSSGESDDEKSPEVMPEQEPDEEITVHRIVNYYLTLLPEEAKSSYQTGDSGYDTYLRDANRQVNV